MTTMKRFILVGLIAVLLATAAAAQPIPPAAKAHYLAARTAFMGNDLNKALEEINAAIVLVPENSQPYFLRGSIYMARMEFTPAEADFTKTISLKPDFPNAYTMRGRAFQYQRRLDQAIADFNRALSLEPNNQDALFSRAFAYYQQQKYESAQADVKQAQKLGVQFPEIFLKALAQTGKDRLAPEPTRGLPSEAPPPARPLVTPPQVATPPTLTPQPAPAPAPSLTLPPAVSDLPDLVKLIKRTLPAVVTIAGYNEQGKFTSFGSGFFINGQGHLITNYHVIQSMASAKVKTYDGKTYPMTTILAVDKYADLALCQLDIPGGTPNFLTVSREVPEVGERVVVIGSPQLLEHTVSEGIVSAIRTDTHKGQAIQMTAPISGGSSGGPVLNLKGEVVGVSTFYRQGGQNLNFAIPGHRVLALQASPGKPLVEYYSPPQQDKAKMAYAQGKRLYEARDYRQALEAFREAIKAEPKYASAHNYLGLTYKKLGLFDESAQAYVKAIQLQPQNYVFLYNLGMVMYVANSYDNAATAFQKAIQIKPEDAESHFMLGKTYAQQGNIRGSGREYNILQRLDPKLAQELQRFLNQ
jgi:S1-C subfamily serine protease/Flp pilus assembly protein TadD